MCRRADVPGSSEPETGREREVFAQLGKGGDVATSDLEAICRVVSLYLRVNGTLDDVVSQLEGIGSSLSIPTKEGRVNSLADGLANAIKKYRRAKNIAGLEALLLCKADLTEIAKGGREEAKASPVLGLSTGRSNMFKLKCPECQGGLVSEEGCVKCPSCGYSKC